SMPQFLADLAGSRLGRCRTSSWARLWPLSRFPSVCGADGAFLGDLAGLRVPQFAAQDLADAGLGQFAAELDVSRPLVTGQLVVQVVLQFALGQRFVLLDHEQLDRLAGLFVGYANRGGLEHARMRAGDLLDLVRIHVEARD